MLQARFAKRVSRLSSNAIRDILTVIEQPGMVSFAGGLPAPQSFVSPDAFRVDAHYLQYGPSAGEQALRERVADELMQRGLTVSPEHVLILSGSQQGIDLVAKLMVGAGTRVAIESPTYLAALQAFDLFGAHYLPFDPVNPQRLAHGDAPALIYTIPTFQNPTGFVYSREQRQALAQICDESDSVLFEDDPYRELAYEPCERTPISALLKSAPWIYQSSFSKTLAPGLRLGYLASSPELFPHLLRLKQAADLHSNRIAQQFVLDCYDQALGDQRLQQIRDLYRGKRDAFNAALTEHFSEIAQWDCPKGGLFFWLRFNNPLIDTEALLAASIELGFAFMPGRHFFSADSADANRAAIRLNFSHASQAEMQTCLAKLASLVKRYADNHCRISA